MEKDSKIYVAGNKGLVGSAFVRRLQSEGYNRIITRSHAELDLLDQAAVAGFFSHERPEYVFLAAAKVGGIHANNTYPAEFIYENLMVQSNVIHQAFINGVTKLLFLGSSCIYPREAPQPMKEEYLMTGPLEPTNSPYATAKIAGIEMCRSYNRQYGTEFIPVMPTNLYGPNDNFDLQTSHVFPALIRKLHEAKEKNDALVEVWGTGKPRREFLHVDDMADACVFLMDLPFDRCDVKASSDATLPLINIGTGTDITIGELAVVISDVVGFEGEMIFDPSKPDGMPRKLLDSSRLNALGWSSKISLRDGIESTYKWFLDNEGYIRK